MHIAVNYLKVIIEPFVRAGKERKLKKQTGVLTASFLYPCTLDIRNNGTDGDKTGKTNTKIIIIFVIIGVIILFLCIH